MDTEKSKVWLTKAKKWLIMGGVVLFFLLVLAFPSSEETKVNTPRDRHEETKPKPAETYTKLVMITSNGWEGIAIPQGWAMNASWGNAPLDVRFNQDPAKTYILPEGPVEYGYRWYQQWRINERYQERPATVTCVFTKI